MVSQIEDQIASAVWWCEKCRMKWSKEITPEQREGIEALMMFIGGKCEDCSE